MHPDTGAIIGIALAGSVLLMASLLLCILHLPCCKDAYKIQTGNGNRRNIRPSSTSSHAAFANMELRGSRNLDELSAANLHHQNQNQAYICSATGIVNPMWQIRCTCHSSGMMTTSQQSLNFAPCVSINNHCQFHHQPHAPPLSHLDHPSNTADSHSFQYYSPQLLSPSDAPPPYPGSNQDTDDPSNLEVTTNSSATHPPVPPYSPKRNSVMI